MSTYKPVLNNHQKSKQGRGRPPKPILRYHESDVMRDDTEVIANLDKMINDFFASGGTEKVYSIDGKLLYERDGDGNIVTDSNK